MSFIFLVIFTPSIGISYQEVNAESFPIPEWIKNNAKLWSAGLVDNETFLNGIKYLNRK